MQKSRIFGASSKLFGRHKIGIFNRTDKVRLGWTWKGGAHDGRHMLNVHFHYHMIKGRR